MGFFRRSRRASLLDSESKKSIRDIHVSGIDPIYGGITTQGLPVQLNIVINYLEYVAIRLPEVFAKEVSQEEVMSLQENINRDQANAGHTIIQLKNPHLVGALLIHQLKQLHLKNPICSDIIIESWHEGCASKEKVASISHFQKSISQMDSVMYNIFWKLCRLFKSMHLEVEVTKMSSTRLCLIFVPLLFPISMGQNKEYFDGLDKCILLQSYIFDRFPSDEMSLGFTNYQESLSLCTQYPSLPNVNRDETKIMMARLIDYRPDIQEDRSDVKETKGDESTIPAANLPSCQHEAVDEHAHQSLFQEVILLQYCVLSHEKRLQLNATVIKEQEEENMRLVEEHQKLETENEMLRKETADLDLDFQERQILDQEKSIEELCRVNEELSRTIEELEVECEKLESPLANPEDPFMMLGETEASQFRSDIKEMQKEIANILKSSRELANEINAVRLKKGLPLLVIHELDLPEPS